MHGEHGCAAVYDFSAPVCHHECNRSAAALVYFAKFTDLPAYACFVENGADLLEEFSIGIIAACFAAGSAVLGQVDAVAQEGCVVFSDTSGNIGSRQELTSAESISLFSMVS